MCPQKNPSITLYCSTFSTDVLASPAKLSPGSTRFSTTVIRPCTSAELRQTIPRCCSACCRAPSSARKCSYSTLRTLKISSADTKFIIISADDMQGHSSSLPKDAAIVTTQLSSCAKNICNWCEAKRLQLNAGKMACCGSALPHSCVSYHSSAGL